MKNELLEISKKLISYKTVKGNNKEIADCIDFIKKYFSTEIAAGKVIAREYNCNDRLSIVLSNIDSLKFDIIFNGHIDVVAADDKDFTAREDNGNLYGRGAGDMKSQIAVMMAVFKEYINSGTKKSIALMLTSDEEDAGESGVKYLLNEIGYRAKIALIPDGGENFEIVEKEKGGFWFRIETKGKSAHGSRPWHGENAILKIMDFYRELEKIFPPQKKSKAAYIDGVSLNLGKIGGGVTVNAVPEKAEMYIDIRYSDKRSEEKIIKSIRKLAKKYRAVHEIVSRVEMFEIDPENEYLIKYKKSAARVLKRRIKIIRETGASDARFFADNNIPAIATNLKCGNLHGQNEWAEAKSIEYLYLIIKEFLTSLN